MPGRKPDISTGQKFGRAEAPICRQGSDTGNFFFWYFQRFQLYLQRASCRIQTPYIYFLYYFFQVFESNVSFCSPSCRCTKPSTRIVSVLLLIKRCKDLFGIAFIIISAGLLSPWIYLTSVISRRSQNCRNTIISIIRRFFLVVPSFTRHSQRDLESVQTIRRRTGRPSYIIIISKIIKINKIILNPLAISQISDASTERVIRLYLIKF